jgi:glycosyltransferase involved in cell wall biosynthesis
LNIHIITSSYPASADDPSGTAGLFVRQFAVELAAIGHRVIVQPVARKNEYQADPGIVIVPLPWKGGGRELASMDMTNPGNWRIFLLLFIHGIRNTFKINDACKIDRTLCMWTVPAGLFGFAGKRKQNIPYDIWALGSDIWKIRKIPLLGKMILRMIIKNADRVFADGMELCRDVTEITGVPCEFLPSSRKLPPPNGKLFLSDAKGLSHLLYVGRYHVNKGPDLLIQAVGCLPYEIKESVRVHMFGLGPLENELRNKISEMQLDKYISLRGPIRAQAFANYLDSVSFLVIPSRVESIPVVFSDALQMGTPVVSMPVGDLQYMIREFNCGTVAEEVSAEALASALEKALAAGKDFFREGTIKASGKFDIRSTVDKWLNVDTADC